MIPVATPMSDPPISVHMRYPDAVLGLVAGEALC